MHPRSCPAGTHVLANALEHRFCETLRILTPSLSELCELVGLSWSAFAL
jgi:hypothetical protein